MFYRDQAAGSLASIDDMKINRGQGQNSRVTRPAEVISPIDNGMH